MASFASAGNPEFDQDMKWVIVPLHERAKPEDCGASIFNVGDILDPEVPIYKLVPLDNPLPDAFAAENEGNAAHAAG